MRTPLTWALPVLALAGAIALPASAAQAAAGDSCGTTPLKDGKLSRASVTVCRDASGTVTTISGSVTDLKAGDHKCARLDIVQVYGDLDEGEYVNTIDVACGGTTPFNHASGWVNADVQLSLIWVAGGSEG
jgi:hypothetical protein